MGDRPTRTARVTIADVARAAGVAPSTVSLVMNASGPVSAATRERVVTAARGLGWSGADPLARSLRRGRTGVIGVVVGERLGYAFSDPMAVGVLDGLAEEVGANGGSLLLVPARADGRPAYARLGQLAMDAAVLLDGALDVAAAGEAESRAARDLLAALDARGVPAVGVDGPIGGGVPLVRIDDEGATAALVGHLAALGHRRFGVVVLPGGTGEGTAVPIRRTRAGLDAVAALGGQARCEEVTANVVAEGERVAGALLDVDRPTALVAQSDVLAVGCLRAAAARGLSVPGDVSVVGFDGVDLPLLGGTELTTVRQPAADKGRAAARLVTARLAGEHPDDVRLPTQLRVGTTSARARTA